MLFDDRVPEHYYIRLVRLLGREEAERFLEKINYDIKAIIIQISLLEILQFAAQKPIFAALIISPIAILIIYFIWELILEPFFF
jgi:hypothetical protein